MLSKAKEMMISSYKSIAEISFECGFNTPTYFSKLFKFCRMVQLIIQTVTVDEKENTRGAVLSVIDISKI